MVDDDIAGDIDVDIELDDDYLFKKSSTSTWRMIWKRNMNGFSLIHFLFISYSIYNYLKVA
jgi:hypothetical protein